MKKEDLSKLSVEELQGRVAETQKRLNGLKLTHAVSPIENPIQLRFIRKDIARLQTELNSRKRQN